MKYKVDLGATLRTLRENKKYNAKEVAEILTSKYGINLQYRTLYGYETGRAFPNTDVFLALCEIYECYDVLYTFGYTSNESVASPLNTEDTLILKKYHALPPSGRNLILGALGIEKDSIQQKIS